MSRMKPMSSIRSASSRTRTSTADRSMVRWPTWSSRRPGVATTTSGPGPELRDLGPDADAAVDRRGADRAVAPVGAEALLDLDRELARRHDDEDAHAVPLLAAVAAGRVEGLDDRQDERGRLAGAGLGAGEHVAAVEDGGDRRGLDRGGDRVALVGHGEEQLGRQPETIEGHEENAPDRGPSRSAGPGQGDVAVGRDQAAQGPRALTGAPIEHERYPSILPDRGRSGPNPPDAAWRRGRMDWTAGRIRAILEGPRRMPVRPTTWTGGPHAR